MVETLRTLALKVVPKKDKPENYFYITKMPALALAKMKIIPVRQSVTRSGIQRLSDEKRIKQIASYIANKEASFPNSIIVSFTENLNPTAFDGKEWPDIYVLNIPIVEKSAIIIDGQHRLLGIERSGIDVEILVTAFMGIAENKQAAIFRDINFYQKKVNKSLMYDLFHVAKDAEFPLMRAIDITERLNEDGPLQGYIKLTGIGEGVVTQAVFVETIEQFLRDGDIFRQKEYEESGGLEVQSQVIKSFYDSVKGNYKDVWEEPREYILLKTTGVYALLMLLRDILWFFHRKREGIIPSARDFEPFAHKLSKRITFSRAEYGETYLGAGGQKRFYLLLKLVISELIQ